MPKDKLTNWQRQQLPHIAKGSGYMEHTAGALMKTFKELVTEESQTVEQYRALAARLENIGFKAQAEAVRKVANQEGLHATIFTTIANDIWMAQQ